MRVFQALPRPQRVGRGIGVLAVAAAVALSVAVVARDARACGGCFHEPQPPTQSGTVVTDHRMIFSISLQQTTLYDAIKYAGSPTSFAWVLPTRGQVTVGLSSDVVFSALEQATATDIISPPLSCPSCNCGGAFGSGSASGSSSGSGFGGSSSGGVTVLSQQTIGPYVAVQLQSIDPHALETWLAANGYVIPSDVQPIIDEYVREYFGFLALKLAPGQGIQDMQPVRVTSPGAGLSLPLRMVAAGTGATVGITLWVIADGRYEPQNFQSFTISPADLTWDWSASQSNYTTLQVQKEVGFNNAAWQIESSLALSPYTIENTISRSLAGFGSSSGSGSGSSGSGYAPLPGADGGATQTAAQLQMDDMAALFPEGGVTIRVTRMRAGLVHTALVNDLFLTASADQSTLSNIYQVTRSVNAPACPFCGCSNGSSGLSGSSGASSSGYASTSSGASSSGYASTSSGAAGTGGGSAGDGGLERGVSPGGSSGCSASTSDPDAAPLQLLAAGFLGMALLRARRRRS
jgi:MYXO-CTERM domain-containing protein